MDPVPVPLQIAQRCTDETKRQTNDQPAGEEAKGRAGGTNLCRKTINGGEEKEEVGRSNCCTSCGLCCCHEVLNPWGGFGAGRGSLCLIFYFKKTPALFALRGLFVLKRGSTGRCHHLELSLSAYMTFTHVKDECALNYPALRDVSSLGGASQGRVLAHSSISCHLGTGSSGFLQ